MRALVVLVPIVAVAFAAASFQSARGAASATGDLGPGGTAKGDISKTAGELDTISIDLEAGTKLDVKWSAGFPASVRFFDVAGVEIPLDLTNTHSVSHWPVPATGRYRFEIASSDGTQGRYSLTALPAWDKTVVLEGANEQTFDLPMPASSAIKGKVESLPGASNPSILSLKAPSGTELLVAPVTNVPAVAKLKSINCTEPGVYHFTAMAAAGTEQFRATLKRRTPRMPRLKVDISNGLDQISYETAGVKDYFDRACKSCHSWAGTYAGVRAYAKNSLGRMRTGNMPKGGGRASGATIDLVAEWITTGYGH